MSPVPILPEDIHLIFERLGFICKWRELFILRLHIQEFFFKLFTTDPVVIFWCFQPKEDLATLIIFDIRISQLNLSYLHDNIPLPLVALYLKVSSCSCSSCVCSWRCLRPAGLFISSMESDWLSRSIRTWFSASKLLFSSCSAATCGKEDDEKGGQRTEMQKEKGVERNGRAVRCVE